MPLPFAERGALVASADRLHTASVRDVAAALRDYVELDAGASHAAQRHAKPLTICFTLDDGDLYDDILRNRATGGGAKRDGAPTPAAPREDGGRRHARGSITPMRFGMLAVGAAASAVIALRLLELAA